MEDRREQEIDLEALWRGIRRRLVWISLLALLGAAAVYLLSSRQRPVYESSTSMIASNTQTQDGLVGGSGIKAPPLPEGALNQALQSTQVITPLLASIQTDSIFSAPEKSRLSNKLQTELRQQKLQTLDLTSRLDLNGNGIYTLAAQADTALGAQRLADLASKALLDWDRGRASQNIVKALADYQAQLAQTDQQLANGGQTPVERQTIITRRARVQDQITQVTIFQKSISGVLSPLAGAVVPLTSVAPKPLRNALLTALLVGLLGIGVAALLTVLDRTIRSEDDLLALNMPTLGTLPRLRKRDIVFSGIVRAARQAGLYEAIGFLRVNLLTAFPQQSHPIIMVSSTIPGEGKSSLTATLADGFASSGNRVLIIDADLRRGTQSEVWEKFNQQGKWRQLCGEGGARTTQEAFVHPQNVQVLQAEENVDVLPAGPSVQDSLSLLNQADIGTALKSWRQHYDIILIDSAPLLALADGLIVGVHADGVLMVVEHGKTSTQAIRTAIRRAERAGLKIMGFVINKSDTIHDVGYTYDYRPRSTKAGEMTKLRE